MPPPLPQLLLSSGCSIFSPPSGLGGAVGVRPALSCMCGVVVSTHTHTHTHTGAVWRQCVPYRASPYLTSLRPSSSSCGWPRCRARRCPRARPPERARHLPRPLPAASRLGAERRLPECHHDHLEAGDRPRAQCIRARRQERVPRVADRAEPLRLPREAYLPISPPISPPYLPIGTSPPSLRGTRRCERRSLSGSGCGCTETDIDALRETRWRYVAG